jgi:hypothetical protein
VLHIAAIMATCAAGPSRQRVWSDPMADIDPDNLGSFARQELAFLFIHADDCMPEQWAPPMADPCEAGRSAFERAAGRRTDALHTDGEAAVAVGICSLSTHPELRQRLGATRLPAIRVFKHGRMRNYDEVAPEHQRGRPASEWYSEEGILRTARSLRLTLHSADGEDSKPSPYPYRVLDLSGAHKATRTQRLHEARDAHPDALGVLFCSSLYPGCHRLLHIWEKAADLIVYDTVLATGNIHEAIPMGWVDCSRSNQVCTAENGARYVAAPSL